MWKVVLLAVVAALAACSDAPSVHKALAGSPITLQQAEASLCAHVLNDLSPLMQTTPVPFDTGTAGAWGAASKDLSEDSTLYELAGDATMALRVRGLAQSADNMRAAIDQPGEPTAESLLAGSDAIAQASQSASDKVQEIADALGRGACGTGDRVAQSDLRNALVAAKTYYTDSSTYSGFDPVVGASIEPSLTWVSNGPAFPESMSINLAEGGQLVLSTMSIDGHPFCIADDAFNGTSYGTVDAQGAIDVSICPDPSWEP